MTNFRCASPSQTEEGPDIRHRVPILKIKLITLLNSGEFFGFYDLKSIKKCEIKFCASHAATNTHKHIKLGR